MRAIRARDTTPEIELRAALHRAGLRFRVDVAVLGRRRADIVFAAARVLVFVDGCFWHGCSAHGRFPNSNSRYWRAKLLLNKSRDLDTTKRLTAAGWTVVRVWEHEAIPAAARRVFRVIKFGSGRQRPIW